MEQSCQPVSMVSVDTPDVDSNKDASMPVAEKKRPPRSERKRLLRQQKLAEQKLRRIEKRENKRQQKSCGSNREVCDQEDKAETSGNEQEDNDYAHIPKKRKLELMKERQKQALLDGQRIAIDCSLEKHMSPKECSKLAQQLCRLYGQNRKCEQPSHLYFTGLNKGGHLYRECVRKNAGFENYMVDMTETHHAETFPRESIVCLSPDSPNVLSSIDKDKVYIIGGLVDEHIQKGKSVSSAETLELPTVRLPLDEYMEKTEVGTYKKVLTVNQVFGILLTFMETNDWKTALKEWVPARHGFRLKEEEDS